MIYTGDQTPYAQAQAKQKASEKSAGTLIKPDASCEAKDSMTDYIVCATKGQALLELIYYVSRIDGIDPKQRLQMIRKIYEGAR